MARVLASLGLAVAILVVVASLVAYHGIGLGWPQPNRELVQSGVQSVTICDEYHGGTFNLMPIPGGDVGLWESEKKGGCYVWYHYADSEE